jgi:hypothetical protein
VRAMSALASTSGSSSIGNCMDQRHLLRRIAQRQASDTHRFCSMLHFQWNCQIETSINPRDDRMDVPEAFRIPLYSVRRSTCHNMVGDQALQRMLITVTPGSKLVNFYGNLQIDGNHLSPTTQPLHQKI